MVCCGPTNDDALVWIQQFVKVGDQLLLPTIRVNDDDIISVLAHGFDGSAAVQGQQEVREIDDGCRIVMAAVSRT